EDNTPAALFQALCLALLFSARISADLAVRAMRALLDQGWTTPAKLAAAPWAKRVQTLNEAGYARFDERTSTMLEDTARRLVEEYGGDLRRLRTTAERRPAAERRLLTDFKGIGDVGVDIFFREAQTAWPELAPFADKKALQGARSLGLPDSAEGLAELVDQSEFPRLITGLVRMELTGDAAEIARAADQAR
ncbi:MAG: endonuclease, partial [Wenzhouxiangella sp.]